MINDTSEDPVHAFLIMNQDGLFGYSERYNPNSQEEEEEKDILHLQFHKTRQE